MFRHFCCNPGEVKVLFYTCALVKTIELLKGCI